MDEALEKKMREVIDRNEIWQVMQRYGRGLDRLDEEMLRSCYFEDCIEDHGHFVGDIDGFVDYTNDAATHCILQHHHVLNHYCDLDGDDAHCETYYMMVGVRPTAPHLLSMGRYVDHFQRRNGEWRIANRVCVIEKNLELNDFSVDFGALKASYGPEDDQPASQDRNDVSYQRPLRPRAPQPMIQR